LSLFGCKFGNVSMRQKLSKQNMISQSYRENTNGVVFLPGSAGSAVTPPIF